MFFNASNDSIGSYKSPNVSNNCLYLEKCYCRIVPFCNMPSHCEDGYHYVIVCTASNMLRRVRGQDMGLQVKEERNTVNDLFNIILWKLCVCLSPPINL